MLAAVAADPPTSASQASVAFTNGLRALPGAYFNFTESAGLTSANLTVTELVFAVPANLSTTNNLFVYHGARALVRPSPRPRRILTCPRAQCTSSRSRTATSRASPRVDTTTRSKRTEPRAS